MNRHTGVILEARHALIGALPQTDFHDGRHIIGADFLTGCVLEARVALEACNS